MQVATELFRSLVGSFPTGVTVVMAWDKDLIRRGLTVNAFCSVSLDPPLVLICVDRNSQTLPAIETSGRFTANLLAEGHGPLALEFAAKATTSSKVCLRETTRRSVARFSKTNLARFSVAGS